MIRIWHLLVSCLLLPATAVLAMLMGLNEISDSHAQLSQLAFHSLPDASIEYSELQFKVGNIFVAISIAVLFISIHLVAGFGILPERSKVKRLMATAVLVALLWIALYAMHTHLWSLCPAFQGLPN